MNELKEIGKKYNLFEESGRIRQPLLRYLSLHPYSMADPGKYREFYIHREMINGQEHYFEAQVSTPACLTYPRPKNRPRLDDRLAVIYSPIEAISFVYPYPFRTRTAHWQAYLVEVTARHGENTVERTAFLRVAEAFGWNFSSGIPAEELCEDHVTCRYMDEDDAPDRVVIWRTEGWEA